VRNGFFCFFLTPALSGGEGAEREVLFFLKKLLTLKRLGALVFYIDYGVGRF